MAVGGAALAGAGGVGLYASRSKPTDPKPEKQTRKVTKHVPEKKEVGDDHFSQPPNLLSPIDVKESNIHVSFEGNQKEETLIRDSGLNP
ncbi:hypothetical protein HYU14_04880 [Candidatus Woesearchaeota archaeon]|nr:hypothetical protein [Candidatus Woesearchaeota archaeon]